VHPQHNNNLKNENKNEYMSIIYELYGEILRFKNLKIHRFVYVPNSSISLWAYRHVPACLVNSALKDY
jgi:hypothetical protein